LQVGGVSPELTRKLLSILEADDSTTKRFQSIKFFDRNQGLIDKLAIQHDGLKPAVQFTLSGSVDGKLPAELKDSSIDFALLDSQGLADQQQTELLSNAVRILKPGGKLLMIGQAGTK